jgi:hypothetical protein
MYFSEQPSLNICRQHKSELENWMSSLPNPLRQYIQLGEVPNSPRDQAEATVSFEAESVRHLSNTISVQFTFYAPRGVDVGHKAFLVEGVENEDVK